MTYIYGMRLRPCSIGAQPLKGLLGYRDDPDGRYFDILTYSRPLTEKELTDYELDYLGEQP